MMNKNPKQLEKEALEISLKKIDESLLMTKKVQKDPRNSLRIQRSISDLNWERSKIKEKLSKL